MDQHFFVHGSLLAAMVTMGFLVIAQIVVADIAAVRVRHTPGAPVDADHGSFLFRATRAHANTNESIAIFLLFACAGVLAGANATWISISAWIYVAARLGHALCYYADQRLLRSGSFVLAVAALVSMGVAVAVRLLQ